jgi:hypothetical protein
MGFKSAGASSKVVPCHPTSTTTIQPKPSLRIFLLPIQKSFSPCGSHFLRCAGAVDNLEEELLIARNSDKMSQMHIVTVTKL